MKIVSRIDISALEPLLDKRWLIKSLWKLGSNVSEGEKVLQKFLDSIEDYGLQPKIVYEKYESTYDGETLRLIKDNEGIVSFRLKKVILEKMSRARVLSKEVVLIAVTVGSNISKVAEQIREDGGYQEYFYLSGLAAAFTEALVEYIHRAVCKEFGHKREKSFRISPGYPVWQKLEDQVIVSKLLPFGKIGMDVSATYQLTPEFSITALVMFTQGKHVRP